MSLGGMLFGGGAFSQWSVVCEMVLAAGKARDEKVVLGAIGWQPTHCSQFISCFCPPQAELMPWDGHSTR